MGEYVVATDGADFVVQTRQAPYRGSSSASVNVAVAMNVGGDRIGFYVSRTNALWLNGAPIAISGAGLALPAGGTLVRTRVGYRVNWPTGEYATVAFRSDHLNLAIRAPTMGREIVGLLGTFDGDDSNEIQTRTGEILPVRASHAELYQVFGDSWRVTQEESLFDYLPGEDVSSFVDLDFPTHPITASTLPTDIFNAAREVCSAQGIEEATQLEECILDVGVVIDSAEDAGGGIEDPATADAVLSAAEGIAEVQPQTPVVVIRPETYYQDFETFDDGLWSTTTRLVIPPNELMLGGGAVLGPLDGGTPATLVLDNLPDHASVSVAFDTHMFGAWNGEAWQLLADGQVVSHTSFSNGFGDQAFPDQLPGQNPPLTGALGVDVIDVGSGPVLRGVYHHSYSFAHSGGTLVLAFSSGAIGSLASWALDTVEVTVSDVGDPWEPKCSPEGPDIDDGNPCTKDRCDPDVGVLHTPQVGMPCLDGDPCNGAEACDASGQCVSHPLDTDDGSPCTYAVCVPEFGVVQLPFEAGTPCHDNDHCNGAETCDGAGACVPGVPPDPATLPVDDDCDMVDDDCDGTPDDDYVGTGTQCGIGACVAGGELQCVNGSQIDTCAPLFPASSDTLCDLIDDDCDGQLDEDFQTVCEAGGVASCVDGAQVVSPCEDGSACTADGCADGACIFEPTDCDDGDPCTADSCSDALGCQNVILDTDADGAPDCSDECPTDPAKGVAGVCGCGTPDTDGDGDGTPDCNDGCPADAGKVAGGTCGCGVSDTDSDVDGTPDCNDGCPNDGGKTVPGACGCGVADIDGDGDGVPDCDDECPADANKAAPGACGCGNPDTDTDGDGTPDCNDECPTDGSRTSAAPDDATCDGIDDDCDAGMDEDFIETTTTCGVGACGASGTLTCQNGATVDDCVASAPPSTDDTTCDGVDDDCDGVEDEDYVVDCQGDDVALCVAGAIAPSTCDDGDACTADTCVAGACVSTGQSADDGNPCTADACDSGSGVTNTPTPGVSCDDGDGCTTADVCDASGGCSGTPVVVDDGNPCTVDACDVTTGVSHTPTPGAACDDNSVCTTGEVCQVDGGCGGATVVVCDDGLFCNGVETCDSVLGCQAGTPVTIDDGIVCTTDSCDEDNDVVLHTPDDLICNNGDACDGVEACDPVAGCLAGVPPVVDDGNPCTVDSCDPDVGVINANLPAGTACGPSLFCDGEGTCLETCPDIALTASDPALTLASHCSVENVTISGGTLIVTGQLYPANLTITTGTLRVEAGGILGASSAASVSITGGTVVNNGLAQLPAFDASMIASSSFVNRGQLDIATDALAVPAGVTMTESGQLGADDEIGVLLVEGVINHDAQGAGVAFSVAGDATVASGGSINATGRGLLGGLQGSNSGDRAQGYAADGTVTTSAGSASGAGGSHGGRGGNYDGTSLSAPVYDSVKDPVLLGGGGGARFGWHGGNGGGRVDLVVGGTLVVNGTIQADGTNGTSPGAGGAGGSVRLQAGVFSGSGTVRANGGRGGRFGGGGRVSVRYTD
ncbi:MAG: hypothetical protein OXU20_28960, partial [Myxococcales bacterium]|nr:hypothetical protein [Myxococcales bacterium]